MKKWLTQQLRWIIIATIFLGIYAILIALHADDRISLWVAIIMLFTDSYLLRTDIDELKDKIKYLENKLPLKEDKK